MRINNGLVLFFKMNALSELYRPPAKPSKTPYKYALTTKLELGGEYPQDLPAAKKLMAEAAERIPALGVLEEFVKRTTAMIRTLSKEEAHLVDTLEVTITMKSVFLKTMFTLVLTNRDAIEHYMF